MQSSDAAIHRRDLSLRNGLAGLAAIVTGAGVIVTAGQAAAADAATNNPTSDPVLGLMLEKGMITEDEAAKVQAQVDARRTNMAAQYAESSPWKISTGIKNLELYGDLRTRYEGRAYSDPGGDNIHLDRFRYAVRVGLRGEAFDDFYYGVRAETSANPRSSWVTLGTPSSSIPPSLSVPYQGPFGKAAGGIDIGQVYLGWWPESWFDFTVGKMPNPLYTTPMVWSSTINPEGAAERVKYTVGAADFFAAFGQFIYADQNPNSASGGLGINGLTGQSADNIFQIAWQLGVNYQITTNISAKVGATIYQYYGLQRSSALQSMAPYFGDPYVGEGAYTGPNTINNINGASGYSSATQNGLLGYESMGYPNNQVGLNNLTVLEVPFELNFKISKLDARVFGDVAYNFDGAQRARDAAAGYAAYLANQSGVSSTISAFAPQTKDVMAYQVGFAIGSRDALGMVNGSTAKKHAWEARTYWQHVEQYALDPNLPDTDFFAGAQNMEGIYTAFAYGFSDNFIGTVRYGYANRINSLLGTGGTGQDIPQINPIDHMDLFQVDLTFKF